MATTEEMNRVMEAYDTYIRPWAYHDSWDVLLSLWAEQVRPKLDPLCEWDVKTGNPDNEIADTYENIENAIAGVDRPEAHRLIYEAIVWLNQNKPK